MSAGQGSTKAFPHAIAYQCAHDVSACECCSMVSSMKCHVNEVYDLLPTITVEGNCPDDQDEKHDSPSVRQNEASTNDKGSDMSTESDTHCSAEPLTEANPMTIPRGVNALSNAPAMKKKFTPPNVPKVTAPQKRSAAAGESNSRPSKKVKTMCAEENNVPQPKPAKVKPQKLKAEGKAEKHLQNAKQTLGSATVRPEKPLPVWVQCGSCQKWRVVHDCADPSTLPDEWKCDMNSGMQFWHACILYSYTYIYIFYFITILFSLFYIYICFVPTCPYAILPLHVIQYSIVVFSHALIRCVSTVLFSARDGLARPDQQPGVCVLPVYPRLSCVGQAARLPKVGMSDIRFICISTQCIWPPLMLCFDHTEVK